MPRKPRVEFAGAVYHVMCRGDRREEIFRDDGDRECFLETLWAACERTGWRTHAHVLMGNHYHLLLETPEANLVAGMRWFQGTYTARFNARHHVGGHLFQGRYKALPVAPEEAGYFLQVSSYIHLNPVRAGLVRPGIDALESFAWSSYPEYLKAAGKRRTPIVVERVLGELGLEDNPAGRSQYAAHLERLGSEVAGGGSRNALEREWKQIRRGWYLGSEAFRRQVQDLVEEALCGKQRKSFSGAEAKAHDETAAAKLLASARSRLGLDTEELSRLPKLDHRKQVAAWWVRKQTTVNNRWLAAQLCMGDEGNIPKAVKTVEETRDGSLCNLKARLAPLCNT